MNISGSNYILYYDMGVNYNLLWDDWGTQWLKITWKHTYIPSTYNESVH